MAIFALRSSKTLVTLARTNAGDCGESCYSVSLLIAAALTHFVTNQAEFAKAVELASPRVPYYMQDRRKAKLTTVYIRPALAAVLEVQRETSPNNVFNMPNTKLTVTILAWMALGNPSDVYAALDNGPDPDGPLIDTLKINQSVQRRTSFPRL